MKHKPQSQPGCSGCRLLSNLCAVAASGSCPEPVVSWSGSVGFCVFVRLVPIFSSGADLGGQEGLIV